MTAARSSYRAIRDEISRRIASRVWLPGALIPGEEALSVEFGAARATVNRALRELAEAGLIERRRKAGTRVSLHPVREARFVIPLVRQEVEAGGAAYQYRLLSSETIEAPPLIRARLGLSADALLRHVRALHLADRRPYQFEDRYIVLETVSAAKDADFTETGPNEWLVETAPFTHAEFTFHADAAGAEAELLNVEKGAPVFVGERITWLGERPITLVRMIHPSTYRMVTKL
ncbi:UTRA domain-containing protein [Aliihoeflea sp. 40Bstr573]|uniref:GntR family transcriptional regulator n=1 Tax=Aliihoeflea sp. 40Bstr573 TaxID=2696467 RepID=UPI0020943856|nr:UTRA domain-containing protein [Aliihoeflea sp. 40Bstr573]